LDCTDIKILGQLFRGVSSLDREPEVKGIHGRVAKRLALDEETVRRRVESLESEGVIRGWHLLVNPNVLGLKKFGILMTVNPPLRVDEAVRKIKLVRGITYISRPVGETLRIGILCENHEVLRNKVELISELTGTKGLMTYAVRHPRPEIEPTPTDWRIINTLRSDPMAHYATLAEKLGLSSRTVQRRLMNLSKGNVIFFRPDLDYSLLEGCLCVCLFVFYAAGGYKDTLDRRIFARFEDYVLRAGWGSASHGYFEFLIPNVHVAQEIADWTRAQGGVKEVRMSFRDRRLYFHEVIGEVNAGRIKGPSTLVLA
jgi:DNA-binding Lrp family transcriptional regulator